MAMEVVMVITVVAGIAFMMKVSAKENNSNTTLRDNGDDNVDDDR